jgi:hypothetical protein
MPKNSASRWTFHHPFGTETITGANRGRTRTLKMGRVIAKRSFELYRADGSEVIVSVRLCGPAL